VTPSAVSSRIKQLEEIAGVPLFLHADFSLTPAGQECLKDVRDVLQVLEKRFNNPKPTRFTSPFDIRFIARVNRIGNVLSASSLLSSGEA